MSASKHGDPSPLPEDSVSRREFLVRLGVAGALIAGSGLAAKKLWQPNHFVPGFEKEKGLQTPQLRAGAKQAFAVARHRARHGTREDRSRWRATAKACL